MSSRRQAVDKLDRTITRLYTYLSGSEEGEDANELASSGNHQASPSHPIQQRGRRSQQPPPQPPQRSSNNNNNFQQHHHHHLGQQQQQQQLHHQEPEYQQPYAYPPAHAHPFAPSSQQLFSGGPLAGNSNSLGGSTPTSNNSSDHASEITFTESELALTHQGTLPISGNGRRPPFHFLLIFFDYSGPGVRCFFDWIRLATLAFPAKTPAQ